MKTSTIPKKLLITLSTVMLLSYLSCKKEDSTTAPTDPPKTHNPTPYEFEIASYFPGFIVPDYNLTTVEGVEFGKHLYYDEMLSLGGTLEGNACASCHVQSMNFSNDAEGLAVLSHTNLHWNPYFLWDGAKEGTLEDVMEFEINDFFEADINLFRADTMYQRLCFEAFGTEEITSKEMAYAMAQWVRTLISSNSKFDQFVAGKIELSPLELRGQLLFNSEAGDCFHCHSTPLTTDLLFHNNGLDSIHVGMDLGRFKVTGHKADIGKFKTPNLRNIEFTAPYMHDGRFKTLEEVIEFYNSGVKLSNSLDPIMTKEGKENGLNLSPYDKAALVAFLKTLTDESYLNDEKFRSPFE